MEGILTNLIEKRKEALFYYSPYSFLRQIDSNIQFKLFVKDKILRFVSSENHFVYSINDGKNAVVFLYEYLAWDSNFLKQKCFKLFTVLYANSEPDIIITAISSFIAHIKNDDFSYGFIDTPAEDIFLMQCLTRAGFGLIETRLHFFKDNLNEVEAERYPVRKATQSDSDAVAKVAKESRNSYDRLHADFNFTDELADEYLEVYAKAALNGFCDTVLVPDEIGLPLASFLAISHLKADAEKLKSSLVRIVLTSVGPDNKGWHKKLVSETIQYSKEMKAEYVLMTTQSTNRAVFRTCEKLNFKLGAISHILAFNNFT